MVGTRWIGPRATLVHALRAEPATEETRRQYNNVDDLLAHVLHVVAVGDRQCSAALAGFLARICAYGMLT